jgi:hypothetical protein
MPNYKNSKFDSIFALAAKHQLPCTSKSSKLAQYIVELWYPHFIRTFQAKSNK